MQLRIDCWSETQTNNAFLEQVHMQLTQCNEVALNFVHVGTPLCTCLCAGAVSGVMLETYFPIAKLLCQFLCARRKMQNGRFIVFRRF